MTADERVAELRSMDKLEVPFEMLHKRIEALVGRPVWTHEMGTSNWERLVQEARWEGPPSTMQQIVDLIPAEKRIFVEKSARG